jgi:hypothetical protein
VVAGLIANVRETGDSATADVLDGILADEVQHVRFANRWIKKMVSEDRRVLMRVAQAVRFLSEANSRLVPREGERGGGGKVFDAAEKRVPAVNVADRRLAEFTDEEVREILRQAGFRSIIPQPGGEAPA